MIKGSNGLGLNVLGGNFTEQTALDQLHSLTYFRFPGSVWNRWLYDEKNRRSTN